MIDKCFGHRTITGLQMIVLRHHEDVTTSDEFWEKEKNHTYWTPVYIRKHMCAASPKSD